ncbi:MarR family winged helix-turn-helix transcriptional regulator [Kitasatospora sp. NPDC058190]|uniref:MarR family winged helix-turn-helix transcriptional regulator n=1 Tax=Kitasatospora sp. NPDC058190 TaxID=3346371 RepID=UPI0036DAC92B
MPETADTATARRPEPGTGRLLRQAADRFSDRLAGALAGRGVRPKDHAVLATLAAQGPSAQQALGEQLGIDRTSMVGLIDQLEAQGWVVRRRNPADRRAYRIELTEPGVRLAAELAALERQVDEDLLAGLAAADRGALGRLLDLLAV